MDAWLKKRYNFNAFSTRDNDELFCFKVVLTFESVDEILRCDHSYGTSLPVPSHGEFCFSKYYPMKSGNLVEF